MATNCCGPDNDSQVPRDKHIEWMTNLHSSLHNEPVSKIAIPGKILKLDLSTNSFR